MIVIDKNLFEELHVKYENLKSLCKECFLQSTDENTIDNDTDNDTNNAGQVNKIQMSELDENFQVVINTLDSVLNDISSEHRQYLRLIAMKSSILYEQAKTLATDDKEMVAKDLLTNAITLLSNYAQNPMISFIYLRILNHYAYLLSKNDDYDKVCTLLEDSENVYNEIKTMPVKVYNSDDLFIPEETINLNDDTANKLEKLMTNNYQMLSWIYNKLNVHDKFIKNQHLVLQRQLDMRDGNALVWASKTARLASYFIEHNHFRQARYHLSAATFVLDEYENDLKKFHMNDAVLMKWKELHQFYADIGKCWTKYGVYLFNESKNRMIKVLYGDNNQRLDDLWTTPFSFVPKHKGDKIESKGEKVEEKPLNEGDIQENSGGDTEEMKEPLLEFQSLQVSEIENQVTCNYVQKTDEARALFIFTHTWLKRSKSHYTIKEHPLEYINGILDLSELYRYVAFFETDIESQYSVQKRRADALETLSAVLREYRPQCYIPVMVELLRELAEVQLEMMGLNLRRLSLIQENTDVTASREWTIHKMSAMADMHSRLDQFSELSMCDVHGSDIMGAPDDADDSKSSPEIIPSDCEIIVDVDGDEDDEVQEEEESGGQEEGSTDSDHVVVTCDYDEKQQEKPAVVSDESTV